MQRSTLAAIMSVAVLATGAMAIESCSAKRGPDDAGLMVIVTTDGRIDVDSLQVFVWKDKQGTVEEARTKLVYDTREFRLPNTVAILSDGNPTTKAVIKVVAFNKAKLVVDIREHVVQVPVDRVAALPIVLSTNCLRQIEGDSSKCGNDSTCDPWTGKCESSSVLGSNLATYVPGAVVDAGVGLLDSTAPDTSMSDTTDADARDGDTTVSDAPGDTLLVDSDSAGVDTGCPKGTKLCGASCQPTDIAHGCSSVACDPCPSANGTATCSASGFCELSCASDFKKCSGACVAIADPTYGCGPTTCDSSACPPPAGGTLTCSGSACVVGSCGAGTKKCGSACVTTDATNGCAEVARCTACAVKEGCVGSPTTCTCISDAATTTCSGKCGIVKDNCGKDVTCSGCTLPATCGGAGVPSVCGICDFSKVYPAAPGCPGTDHTWMCWSPVDLHLTRTADFVVRSLCGDDVISDARTKLMWARNEEVGNFTWIDAKSRCAASRRGGFSDWRLPTRVELQSIVDYAKGLVPTVDSKFQGGTPGSTATATYLWSSSADPFLPGNAWGVNFDYGGLYSSSTGSATWVRCVR